MPRRTVKKSPGDRGSQDVAGHMLTVCINRAGTQLQPEEKTQLEKAKDELRSPYQRPASGRTTAMGRRVERPGTGKQGGPSGQKDHDLQDRKHANK